MSKYNTQFFIHDDMDTLKDLKIPSALLHSAECYVMQENNIVYLGTRDYAQKFIEVNTGKKMDEIYK